MLFQVPLRIDAAPIRLHPAQLPSAYRPNLYLLRPGCSFAASNLTATRGPFRGLLAACGPVEADVATDVAYARDWPSPDPAQRSFPGALQLHRKMIYYIILYLLEVGTRVSISNKKRIIKTCSTS